MDTGSYKVISVWLLLRSVKAYLESQVARNNGPLSPKVAQNTTKVAPKYGKVALQVGFTVKIQEHLKAYLESQ